MGNYYKLIGKFVENCITENLFYMADNYKSITEKIIYEFRLLPLSKMVELIGFSEKLHKTSFSMIMFLDEIERLANNFQISLSKADFYVKQVYNAASYKLYTSSNKLHWKFFGWANKVRKF